MKLAAAISTFVLTLSNIALADTGADPRLNTYKDVILQMLAPDDGLCANAGVSYVTPDHNRVYRQIGLATESTIEGATSVTVTKGQQPLVVFHRDEINDGAKVRYTVAITTSPDFRSITGIRMAFSALQTKVTDLLDSSPTQSYKVLTTADCF